MSARSEVEGALGDGDATVIEPAHHPEDGTRKFEVLDGKEQA